MNKYFIIAIVALVVFFAFLVFKPNIVGDAELTNKSADALAEEEDRIKPWDITLGIYDPAEEPTKLTKLLESRLKELGFKVTILLELVDPAAGRQERTTLLYRSNTEDKLEVVIDKVINSTLFRRGENQAIEQDVIITTWSIDDINWGSFSDLADEYNSPSPKNVSVLVLNAGAEPGTAGKIAILLNEEGYDQAEALNADEQTSPKPILIYYQRNYKKVAKSIRRLLLDYDFSDGVSYIYRPDQEANIIITLTAEEPEKLEGQVLDLEIKAEE